MTVLVSDLALPEGPLLLSDGGWLITEMAPGRGCITRFDSEGRKRTVVARTGRPNGLALDGEGTLWVADPLRRGVLQLGLDGVLRREVGDCDGEQVLWPNDLCVGPDGGIYVTDSGLLVTQFLDDGGDEADHWTDLRIQGRVLRFDRAGGGTVIDDGLRFANGIAFDADGVLYATEMLTGSIFRYPMRKGELCGERELWANVLDPEFEPEGVRGPDGMAFAEDGRLFCAVVGQGDVAVIARSGEVERRIRTLGLAPTNVAFGPRGSGRILVTEDELGHAEIHDVGVDGLPLYR